MKKLVLGSNSPRRKELLSQLGYTFEVRTKDTDESYPSSTPALQVAKIIAEKKVIGLITELDKNEVLICADTVVIINGEVLGKPKDAAEAKEMLLKLSGKTHQVISAIHIHSDTLNIQDQATTDVSFKVLTEKEIDYYIANYKPFDKAGAYGIQEWIGLIGVEAIKGSYFNVVGLPTHLLEKHLHSLK